MEAWTTSVASDSILPFHLPPPHPPTWVVSGSSAAALASPQIQLRCERCCSPCVRTQVAAAAVSSSLHLGKGVLARSALLSWSAGPSLPFFVKSRTYGLAGSCAVSHPPGVARTAPSLPHLGKDVLAASALRGPSARCLCLFRQVSYGTAWLWAALYSILRVAPHTPLFRTSSLGPWPLTAASEAPS